MRIEKTIGNKMISKSIFYNTFDYYGYEQEVGRLYGNLRVGLCREQVTERQQIS